MDHFPCELGRDFGRVSRSRLHNEPEPETIYEHAVRNTECVDQDKMWPPIVVGVMKGILNFAESDEGMDLLCVSKQIAVSNEDEWEKYSQQYDKKEYYNGEEGDASWKSTTTTKKKKGGRKKATTSKKKQTGRNKNATTEKKQTGRRRSTKAKANKRAASEVGQTEGRARKGRNTAPTPKSMKEERSKTNSFEALQQDETDDEECSYSAKSDSKLTPDNSSGSDEEGHE